MLSLLFLLLASLPYVFAALLGVLVPLLGVFSYWRAAAGMGLVLCIFTAEALYMQLGGLQIGLSLYYTDFVLVFVAAVGLLRLATARDAPRMPRAWVLYGTVFLVSLGSGLAAHGSSAGVQARGYFYSIATTLYVLSFPITDRHVRRLFDALTVVAVVLLLLCVYRWTVYYLPIPELLPEEGTYNVDGAIRVIHSHQVLVMSQVFVGAMFFADSCRGFRLIRPALPLLLAGIVVLQHRSVWLALLAGIVASLSVARSRSRSIGGQMALLASVAALAVLPVVVGNAGGVGEQVANSANNALHAQGTAGERLESWQAMVGNWAAAGPRSIAIGQNFGSDNSRYVTDQTTGGQRRIDYIAHNHYVQTLFNLGLLGLGAFVAAAWWLVHALYRLGTSGTSLRERAGTTGPEGGRTTAHTTASALLVMVVMQLVYYIPYGTDYLQHLLMGVAMAYVVTNRWAAAPKSPATGRPVWKPA